MGASAVNPNMSLIWFQSTNRALKLQRLWVDVMYDFLYFWELCIFLIMLSRPQSALDMDEEELINKIRKCPEVSQCGSLVCTVALWHKGLGLNSQLLRACCSCFFWSLLISGETPALYITCMERNLWANIMTGSVLYKCIYHIYYCG